MGLEYQQAERVVHGSRAPTGTVTFLFTDIEGSTKRWERFGDAMRDAVARHDALLTRTFHAHSGYVFKTMGDAFCVAFSSVHDAVRAAIAVQQHLVGEDWSMVDGLAVRIALHAGSTDERDGDYFGPVVNRVARLLAAAHGGQIVLSASARTLAQTALPPDASLVDLGSHRLKDLSQPETVAQLNVRGLPSVFAPLMSLDTARTNLPLQFAPLVGRAHEVQEIAGLVRAHRLLTLCGAGGIGKTRIACQVGADLLAEFPDGVWFVDFAPISDPAMVSRTLAAIFAVSDTASSEMIERTVAALAGRRLLLILDNCEHVVGAAATLVDALLRACNDVRVLVTTREALHVRGENLYRVPSLSVPARTPALTAETALRYGAIELFVARAASLSAFTLTDENAPVVAEICTRLDGIALAIELAASRVKVLSIRQVAQRLDERFRMLTGGSRTALPRQQTLRALIDWSYDHLEERERIVFRRASVFAAGFDLGAAIAVCSDEAIDEWDVVDLLDALVDKSLLTVEPANDEHRYRLLESTREYARERFGETGEEAPARGRWSAYYRALARQRSADHWSQLEDAGLTALEVENDNFRSLLEWSLAAKNDPVGGLDLAGMLGNYWSLNGFQSEGFLWLEAGLALVDESAQPAIVAQAWLAVACLADNVLLGKRGLEAASRAVRLGGDCGLASVVARGLLYAGLASTRLGHYADADGAFADALARFRSLGERRGVLMCLQSQARNAMSRGQEQVARELYEQVLAIQRELGRARGITVVIANLALLEFACGNAQRARELGREAVERGRGLNDKSLQANLLVNLAAFLIDAGELEGARQAALEAIDLGRERRYTIPVCIAIEHLGLISALAGDRETPAKLLGFTNDAMLAAGFTREITEQRGYDRLTTILSEHFGEGRLAELRAAGRAFSEEQAVALARALS